MWLIDQLADKHITEAIDNGELDNLPGSGQPLQLDDDSMVPEDLRPGYRLLKNAGFLPAEMQLRKDIDSVEQLLAEANVSGETHELKRRMHYLLTQLSLTTGGSSVWQEDYYASKLRKKHLE